MKPHHGAAAQADHAVQRSVGPQPPRRHTGPYIDCLFGSILSLFSIFSILSVFQALRVIFASSFRDKRLKLRCLVGGYWTEVERRTEGGSTHARVRECCISRLKFVGLECAGRDYWDGDFGDGFFMTGCFART